MSSQLREQQRRRRWWLVAIPAVLLLILSVFLLFQLRSGIHVTIQNTGQTSIHSVVLHVTGNSYSIGDLAPGGSKEATVNSAGESTLRIEFTDSDGKKQQLDAGVYLEPGYRGTIRVSIRDGVIDHNDQQISSY
jgi:hypothetical protein